MLFSVWGVHPNLWLPTAGGFGKPDGCSTCLWGKNKLLNKVIHTTTYLSRGTKRKLILYIENTLTDMSCLGLITSSSQEDMNCTITCGRTHLLVSKKCTMISWFISCHSLVWCRLSGCFFPICPAESRSVCCLEEVGATGKESLYLGSKLLVQRHWNCSEVWRKFKFLPNLTDKSDAEVSPIIRNLAVLATYSNLVCSPQHWP